MKSPWYVEAFGADYLERYPHRSPAQAEADVPFLVRLLKARAGARVLDLCCGAGRYSGPLAASGLQVVGVDLSCDLLRTARKRFPAGTFLRADMRALPFSAEVFGGGVNLFTSFGYFESEADDLAALREVVRVLQAGALFLLDFLNLEPTLAGLVPCSKRISNGRRITETRSYDPARRRLEKKIQVEGSGAKEELEPMLESVRAYAPEELRALFDRAGLEVRETFGDLQGASFDARSSPRCVLVGRK